MPASPIGPHSSTPAELSERLAVERGGHPFVVYRDGEGHQLIVELAGANVLIGRRELNDIALPWDVAVSRTHAQLERVGGDWTIADDGLSRHGTFVNGERLAGRRRLADGDVIFVGATTLLYRAPASATGSASTGEAAAALAPPRLTPAQRRVLVALCRPFKDAPYASPAANRAIAAELVVSVDAVKARLKELFDAFGIADLPQNEKRAALAIAALRRGVVTAREL